MLGSVGFQPVRAGETPMLPKIPIVTVHDSPPSWRRILRNGGLSQLPLAVEPEDESLAPRSNTAKAPETTPLKTDVKPLLSWLLAA